jgi:hypothetical protein
MACLIGLGLVTRLVYTMGRLQSTLEYQETMGPVTADYITPDSPTITFSLCACLARSFQALAWCQQISKLVGRLFLWRLSALLCFRSSGATISVIRNAVQRTPL